MKCLLHAHTFYCANTYVLLDVGFWLAVPIKQMTVPSWSFKVRDRVVCLRGLHILLLFSNLSISCKPFYWLLTWWIWHYGSTICCYCSVTLFFNKLKVCLLLLIYFFKYILDIFFQSGESWLYSAMVSTLPNE